MSVVGNCDSPEAGPECPGYRGVQMPRIASSASKDKWEKVRVEPCASLKAVL